MGKYHRPATRPAKPNLFADGVLPVPPAPGQASVHKEDNCRRPPPRPPPATSCLAVPPSPQSGWCGWCRDQTSENGRSLPVGITIGKFASRDLVVLAANVAAVAEKRPVIRCQSFSKVVDVLDVHESGRDIPIRGVSD